MKADINDLVEHFNNGEAAGYKGIFDHFYRDLFYFAWKMVGNKEDAEDVSIQVFTKLFERRADFNTAANIKAFLYISIRNLSLNVLRDRKRVDTRHQQFVSKVENDYRLSLEYEIKPDLLEAVQQAIDSLPETYQRVFKLLMIEQMKPTEVAELLQVSVDTIYQQKTRALKLLRLWLNDKGLIIIPFSYILHALSNKS